MTKLTDELNSSRQDWLYDEVVQKIKVLNTKGKYCENCITLVDNDAIDAVDLGHTVAKLRDNGILCRLRFWKDVTMLDVDWSGDGCEAKDKYYHKNIHINHYYDYDLGKMMEAYEKRHNPQQESDAQGIKPRILQWLKSRVNNPATLTERRKA